MFLMLRCFPYTVHEDPHLHMYMYLDEFGVLVLYQKIMGPLFSLDGFVNKNKPRGPTTSIELVQSVSQHGAYARVS